MEDFNEMGNYLKIFFFESKGEWNTYDIDYERDTTDITPRKPMRQIDHKHQLKKIARSKKAKWSE